jgi:hypothetical protein
MIHLRQLRQALIDRGRRVLKGEITYKEFVEANRRWNLWVDLFVIVGTIIAIALL